MTSTVSIPLWLALLIGLLALIALLDRLLLPGVRWFFRRQVNLALTQLNFRLHLKIPEFKLTRRQILIDRLVYDPQVLLAVDRHCTETGEPREVAMHRIERYAREIVPAFNAWVYFALGARLARWVVRLLYRVRLGSTSDTALADLDPEASIVFVMNHRSNMDYIVVGYLAMERVALSYAVGEWARVWPLQQLIRSLGAYFVRRGSGNPLYRRVLERYVQTAMEGGLAQAIFPEGGLSRDGRLREPRLGLLDYMMRTFDADRGRDVVFVPVGINYDRVLEDRTLLLGADGEEDHERSTRQAISTTLRFMGRNLGQMVKGRWYRFGYACACFGPAYSLRGHVRQRGIDFRSLEADARIVEVKELARTLMHQVGEAVPVLPVSLLASVLLELAGRPYPLKEFEAAVRSRMAELRARGAFIHLPRDDEAYFFEVGLRMMRLRHLITEVDGLIRVVEEEEVVLRYYANAIEHLTEGGDEP